MHKQIENLSIEQMREIVEGAPDRTADTYVADTDTYFSAEFGSYFDHAEFDWLDSDYKSYAEIRDNYETVFWLKDLRTAIAEHDNTDIGTEIDSFLDAFKSPELTDDRKEELTQDWKGMSGGVAFSLIERHADNWKEIDYMMNQWLEANKEAERHG